MTFDVLGQLNWLAVLVGAVIYFALGALWYSPMLFARPWQRAYHTIGLIIVAVIVSVWV